MSETLLQPYKPASTRPQNRLQQHMLAMRTATDLSMQPKRAIVGTCEGRKYTIEELALICGLPYIDGKVG